MVLVAGANYYNFQNFYLAFSNDDSTLYDGTLNDVVTTERKLRHNNATSNDNV